MKFTETSLPEAWVIDHEPRADARGFFARVFCGHEFEDHGIKPQVAQCNLSFNFKKGTLRGMHYQIEPAAEAKLVRCIHGAIYDVIVDLRPKSRTFLSAFGIELTDQNRRALFVPEMFAHGYLTLTENAEVLYQVSEFYAPQCERGLRYDDPALCIKWPVPVIEISEKDKNWPLIPELLT